MKSKYKKNIKIKITNKIKKIKKSKKSSTLPSIPYKKPIKS
jgi:hypothetical protein